MNVQCPHCRREQPVSETLIHTAVECPACHRRFVARPAVAQAARRQGSGSGVIMLLLLLVAGGALAYACWKQQSSPADLARQLLQRFRPQPAQVAPPPAEPEPAAAPPPKSPEPAPPGPPEPAPTTPAAVAETPAAPEPAPAPAVAIDQLAWLGESRTHWPHEVALTLSVRFQLKADGQSVGSILLPPGSLVRLLNIAGDQVTVAHQTVSRVIPMDATDLPARARLEIDRRAALLSFASARASTRPATPPPVAAPVPDFRPRGAFIHPGGLHTKADLDRMKAKVAAREHPWIDAWEQFIADRKAQDTYRAAPSPDMRSRQRAQDDATAMYYNALRWYISGDKSHAECAVRIANDWSETVDQRPANDYLSGIPTGSFALAGELLRVYPGWSASDFKRFKTMLVEHWYPKCHDFLTTHGGAPDNNYWANWDAASMLAVLGIGVLCDDREKFDQAVAYFKNGKGMGSLPNAVPFRYPGGLAQWQESGRDQAHTMGGQGLLSEFCQVAWNQRLDLFGYDDNRLLAGAEYTAQYTLWKGVPYTYYTNDARANQYYVSENYHGRLAASHFELLYNHYVVRKGLKAPHVRLFAELKRPEPGEVDIFGHGTLVYTLDAAASPYPVLAAPPAPRDLVATAGLGRVELKWSPSGAYSTHGYEVSRASAPGGPYTAIHSTDRWTTPRHTDTAVTNGTTYYYRVAALNNTGASAPSAPAGATPAAGGVLPADWTAADIGGRGATPGARHAPAANGTFVVPATGAGIGREADDCHYVYKRVTGDFTLTARLINRTGGMHKMGLMMRESPDADAKMLALTLGEIGGRQTRFGTRAMTGESMTARGGNDYTWIPVWFRLQRTGNEFTASQSSDGATWFPIGTSTVPMRKTFLAGLAAASGDKAKDAPSSATFDNVTLAARPPAEPGAPTALAATAPNAGEVQLTWKNHAADQAGVKVEASTDGELFYEIADLASDATRFVNTGLRPSAGLHYRVRAYNTGGYSAYSNTATPAAP